ncbi:hypothetical protein CVT24_001764 [Panaeolus cyanescens]|uniref:Uncharacterized protein n=1 Tax=Panaeolus cyanescens TaxID=181874 RepID=A0A409YUC3_9AGAR|nr:hypothetical protein CVT24_001764 [Panaeolus cyanescens]
MSAYYPSQAGYATSAQPMMYSASAAGYGQPAYQVAPSASYVQPAGVMVQPQVVSSVGAPVMMQPGYSQGYPQAHHYTWGARLRRFFGLAPSTGMKFKSDRTTWGFMGYSRRQRYVDARTGAEVDKHGRPVIRV